MCWRIRFSAIEHLQKAPIITSLEMCPIPYVPLLGKNIIIFSNKTFQVLMFQTLHITDSYIITFMVNIWNQGKNLQDLSGQNPCENGGLV